MILRLVSLLAQLFIYWFGVTSIHEWAHMLVANNLGVAGHVVYRVDWGRFVYDDFASVLWYQDLIIGLAGGFIVAAGFGILWWIQHQQGKTSASELDTAAIFAIITIFQFSYGIADGIDRWVTEAELIGTLAAVGISGWLYGRRLLLWLEMGDKQIN